MSVWGEVREAEAAAARTQQRRSHNDAGRVSPHVRYFSSRRLKSVKANTHRVLLRAACAYKKQQILQQRSHPYQQQQQVPVFRPLLQKQSLHQSREQQSHHPLSLAAAARAARDTAGQTGAVAGKTAAAEGPGATAARDAAVAAGAAAHTSDPAVLWSASLTSVVKRKLYMAAPACVDVSKYVAAPLAAAPPPSPPPLLFHRLTAAPAAAAEDAAAAVAFRKRCTPLGQSLRKMKSFELAAALNTYAQVYVHRPALLWGALVNEAARRRPYEFAATEAAWLLHAFAAAAAKSEATPKTTAAAAAATAAAAAKAPHEHFCPSAAASPKEGHSSSSDDSLTCNSTADSSNSSSSARNSDTGPRRSGSSSCNSSSRSGSCSSNNGSSRRGDDHCSMRNGPSCWRQQLLPLPPLSFLRALIERICIGYRELAAADAVRALHAVAVLNIADVRLLKMLLPLLSQQLQLPLQQQEQQQVLQQQHLGASPQQQHRTLQLLLHALALQKLHVPSLADYAARLLAAHIAAWIAHHAKRRRERRRRATAAAAAPAAATGVTAAALAGAGAAGPTVGTASAQDAAEVVAVDLPRRAAETCAARPKYIFRLPRDMTSRDDGGGGGAAAGYLRSCAAAFAAGVDENEVQDLLPRPHRLVSVLGSLAELRCRHEPLLAATLQLLLTIIPSPHDYRAASCPTCCFFDLAAAESACGYTLAAPHASLFQIDQLLQAAQRQRSRLACAAAAASSPAERREEDVVKAAAAVAATLSAAYWRSSIGETAYCFAYRPQQRQQTATHHQALTPKMDSAAGAPAAWGASSGASHSSLQSAVASHAAAALAAPPDPAARAAHPWPSPAAATPGAGCGARAAVAAAAATVVPSPPSVAAAHASLTATTQAAAAGSSGCRMRRWKKLLRIAGAETPAGAAEGSLLRFAPRCYRYTLRRQQGSSSLLPHRGRDVLLLRRQHPTACRLRLTKRVDWREMLRQTLATHSCRRSVVPGSCGAVGSSVSYAVGSSRRHPEDSSSYGTLRHRAAAGCSEVDRRSHSSSTNSCGWSALPDHGQKRSRNSDVGFLMRGGGSSLSAGSSTSIRGPFDVKSRKKKTVADAVGSECAAAARLLRSCAAPWRLQQLGAAAAALAAVGCEAVQLTARYAEGLRYCMHRLSLEEAAAAADLCSRLGCYSRATGSRLQRHMAWLLAGRPRAPLAVEAAVRAAAAAAAQPRVTKELQLAIAWRLSRLARSWIAEDEGEDTLREVYRRQQAAGAPTPQAYSRLLRLQQRQQHTQSQQQQQEAKKEEQQQQLQRGSCCLDSSYAATRRVLRAASTHRGPQCAVTAEIAAAPLAAAAAGDAGPTATAAEATHSAEEEQAAAARATGAGGEREPPGLAAPAWGSADVVACRLLSPVVKKNISSPFSSSDSSSRSSSSNGVGGCRWQSQLPRLELQSAAALVAWRPIESVFPDVVSAAALPALLRVSIAFDPLKPLVPLELLLPRLRRYAAGGGLQPQQLLLLLQDVHALQQLRSTAAHLLLLLQPAQPTFIGHGRNLGHAVRTPTRFAQDGVAAAVGARPAAATPAPAATAAAAAEDKEAPAASDALLQATEVALWQALGRRISTCLGPTAAAAVSPVPAATDAAHPPPVWRGLLQQRTAAAAGATAAGATAAGATAAEAVVGAAGSVGLRLAGASAAVSGAARLPRAASRLAAASGSSITLETLAMYGALLWARHSSAAAAVAAAVPPPEVDAFSLRRSKWQQQQQQQQEKHQLKQQQQHEGQQRQQEQQQQHPNARSDQRQQQLTSPTAAQQQQHMLPQSGYTSPAEEALLVLSEARRWVRGSLSTTAAAHGAASHLTAADHPTEAAGAAGAGAAGAAAGVAAALAAAAPRESGMAHTATRGEPCSFACEAEKRVAAVQTIDDAIGMLLLETAPFCSKLLWPKVWGAVAGACSSRENVGAGLGSTAAATLQPAAASAAAASAAASPAAAMAAAAVATPATSVAAAPSAAVAAPAAASVTPATPALPTGVTAAGTAVAHAPALLPPAAAATCVGAWEPAADILSHLVAAFTKYSCMSTPAQLVLPLRAAAAVLLQPRWTQRLQWEVTRAVTAAAVPQLLRQQAVGQTHAATPAVAFSAAAREEEHVASRGCDGSLDVIEQLAAIAGVLAKQLSTSVHLLRGDVLAAVAADVLLLQLTLQNVFQTAMREAETCSNSSCTHSKQPASAGGTAAAEPLTMSATTRAANEEGVVARGATASPAAAAAMPAAVAARQAVSAAAAGAKAAGSPAIAAARNAARQRSSSAPLHFTAQQTDILDMLFVNTLHLLQVSRNALLPQIMQRLRASPAVIQGLSPAVTLWCYQRMLQLLLLPTAAAAAVTNSSQPYRKEERGEQQLVQRGEKQFLSHSTTGIAAAAARASATLRSSRETEDSVSGRRKRGENSNGNSSTGSNAADSSTRISSSCRRTSGSLLGSSATDCSTARGSSSRSREEHSVHVRGEVSFAAATPQEACGATEGKPEGPAEERAGTAAAEKHQQKDIPEKGGRRRDAERKLTEQAAAGQLLDGATAAPISSAAAAVKAGGCSREEANQDNSCSAAASGQTQTHAELLQQLLSLLLAFPHGLGPYVELDSSEEAAVGSSSNRSRSSSSADRSSTLKRNGRSSTVCSAYSSTGNYSLGHSLGTSSNSSSMLHDSSCPCTSMSRSSSGGEDLSSSNSGSRPYSGTDVCGSEESSVGSSTSSSSSIAWGNEKRRSLIDAVVVCSEINRDTRGPGLEQLAEQETLFSSGYDYRTAAARRGGLQLSSRSNGCSEWLHILDMLRQSPAAAHSTAAEGGLKEEAAALRFWRTHADVARHVVVQRVRCDEACHLLLECLSAAAAAARAASLAASFPSSAATRSSC